MNYLTKITLYKKMHMIREAERQIKAHYSEDEMKTPMHMSEGSEAAVVGVCAALGPDDKVIGTYRSHALYIAKTDETNHFFAEMYGKETGCARGKAGSMHLSAPACGHLGSSAIVGSTLPLAVGSAFADKYMNKPAVTAVFFGDGAVDEGSFWESINTASLLRVPVIFVCEDNGFAVHTPVSARHGYKSIINIIKEFNCNVYDASEDPTNVEAIYSIASTAINDVRENCRPAFLYLKYYRYLEHVGVNQDFDAGYRSIEELLHWQKIDPVESYRKQLIKEGYEVDILSIEDQIRSQVAASIEFAKKSPLLDPSEIFQGVYS